MAFSLLHLQSSPPPGVEWVHRVQDVGEDLKHAVHRRSFSQLLPILLEHFAEFLVKHSYEDGIGKCWRLGVVAGHEEVRFCSLLAIVISDNPVLGLEKILLLCLALVAVDRDGVGVGVLILHFHLLLWGGLFLDVGCDQSGPHDGRGLDHLVVVLHGRIKPVQLSGVGQGVLHDGRVLVLEGIQKGTGHAVLIGLPLLRPLGDIFQLDVHDTVHIITSKNLRNRRLAHTYFLPNSEKHPVYSYVVKLQDV